MPELYGDRVGDKRNEEEKKQLRDQRWSGGEGNS